jgi:ABC-type phosphate transport system substrate-binding protein
MSFRAPVQVRRLALGLGAALAVALSSASTASADFTVAQCGGESIFGRGASFQTEAINGFRDIFDNAEPVGCGTNPVNVGYAADGSGAGRRALGERGTLNPNQDRDVSVRFAGTDEPPTAAQRQQIENGPIDANGQDVTDADDGRLHVIPIAIGAITIMVNLPAGCDYTGATNTPIGDRPAMTNETLEGVFAGTVETWGDAIDGLNAACQDDLIVRVVRQDSSGTTFALKQLLANINPNRGWANLANQDWPNPGTVERGSGAGGSALRNKLIDTPGGIGYADLATARGGGGVFTWANTSDLTFWMPMQRRNTGTYDDPQAAADGYQTGNAERGANCQDADVTSAPGDSFGDWSETDSTYSADEYNGCTLTYTLAFDDNSTVYCNSASEERKARTLKDFLELSVTNDNGQDALPGRDYDVLPPDMLAIAQAAVADINWKDGTDGRPCQTVTPPPPPPPPPPGGGTPPPPAPISNAFTIASARTTQGSRSIRLSLQFPGAGQLVVTGSAKPARGKAIRLARRAMNITAAGTQRVNVALNSRARRALNRTRRLRVTLRITYTPQGGTARTVTRRVNVRAPRRSRS